MNTPIQTIYMPGYLKKILLSLFLASILFIFLFLGMNYSGKYFASLFGIISARVAINPLEINITAPSEVEINKVFQVRAEVINRGEEEIKNARGEIFLPAELILLKKDSVQEIGLIPGKKPSFAKATEGKEKKISWQLKGAKEGDYLIMVLASGEVRDQLIYAEDSEMVKVRLSLRKSLWQRLQGALNFLR